MSLILSLKNLTVPLVRLSLELRYLLAGMSTKLQYTKRVFTIFPVGFGVPTLCLAQSRWFHRDGHCGFQVIQRDSQRDEECGVIIDFREIACFIEIVCFIATPCLYMSEREIYDLLFIYPISAHGSKVQLTAYAQKPS